MQHSKINEASMSTNNNTVIVGAGLAGLVAGRRLADAGYEVTILEATERCGGKAGCYEDENGITEHGYHIFPV